MNSLPTDGDASGSSTGATAPSPSLTPDDASTVAPDADSPARSSDAAPPAADPAVSAAPVASSSPTSSESETTAVLTQTARDESPVTTPGAEIATSTSDDEPEGSQTTRPKPPYPRVIAVANQKGGVGKTTTTINLGACMAELGHRTLIIDLDPQANASTGLGIDPRALEHSLYDVILQDFPLEDCIEPTATKNLFLAPSSLDLAGAEIELVAQFSREHRLRLAIDSVKDDYDYVFIDCPPSLGLLTINAMTAAREVCVPIQCEYYALEGLGQLIRNVELVNSSLNPDLEISTIILVMYDGRTKLAGQVVDEVRGHFGDRVCQRVIPRTVRLSEAPSYGQPITTFDSSSKGAEAYRDVAKEIDGVE